jgi:hypothetical protein
MTSCNKKYPFSTAFKLCFKEIFAKGKTNRAISERDSRLLARRADKRLVKNHI